MEAFKGFVVDLVDAVKFVVFGMMNGLRRAVSKVQMLVLSVFANGFVKELIERNAVLEQANLQLNNEVDDLYRDESKTLQEHQQEINELYETIDEVERELADARDELERLKTSKASKPSSKKKAKKK